MQGNNLTRPSRPVIHFVRPLHRLDRRESLGNSPSGGRWCVRGSRSEDVDAWLEIQNEVLAERGAPRGWDRRMWQREMAGRPWWRPERLLVAHALGEAELLGCVALEISDPAGCDAAPAWGQLHWLAVRPSARRQGIASRLVDEAELIARAAGCPELRVETLATWSDTVAFYRSQGFR